jgi:copper transport protein
VTIRRVGAVIAGALTLVVLGASPAFAHATLLQSDPAPGAVLARSPSAVTLRFDSQVSAALGAVRVYDRQGGRVDSGGTDVQGAVVRLRVSGLPKGSYVVTWRVTSADTHPVAGAFTFQIGNAGNASSPAARNLAQRLLAQQGGDPVVGAAYGVTRWLVFAGLALLLGAALFALAVWPGARSSRRAHRLVIGGWVALVGGTVAGLFLYGPYAAGLGLGDVTRLSLLGHTVGIRFGQVAIGRLVLLVLALPVLYAATVPPDRVPHRLARVAGPLGVVLAVALAATPGYAGHAVTGRWVMWAVVADTLHVLAVSVWLGGLVLLVAVLLPGRDVAHLRDALPRWSRLAAGCLAVIVASGTFQAWRQVGTLGALRSTDYGRLLIVKVILFAGMVVLASFSRDVVLHLFPGTRLGARRAVPVVAGGADDVAPGDDPHASDEARTLRGLRRSVWVEIAVGAAVLAVTALLVNAPPARSNAATGTTANLVETTLKSSRLWVDVVFTPGKTGANDLHVSVLKPNGKPETVQDLRLTLDLAARKIPPLVVPLTPLGTGHYLASGFTIPLSGTWRVTARPLLSQFDERTLTATVDLANP